MVHVTYLFLAPLLVSAFASQFMHERVLMRQAGFDGDESAELLQDQSLENKKEQEDAVKFISEELLSETPPAYIDMVMEQVNGRRSWSSILPGAQAFNGTVFYPFAGVDVFSAVSLFPNARSIVMAALHKVGDCQTEAWQNLSSRTSMVTDMMGSFFTESGYFATIQMFSHFDDSGLGVAPFLLAGLHVIGEEPISIDCGADVGPQGSPLGLTAGNAVRISHRNKKTGAVRELVYAHADMLTASPTLDKFLTAMHSQAPLTTMMKATGYILRRTEDNFVNRRAGHPLNSAPLVNMIMNSSTAILQDDTGIRASCLADWSISLWGNYVGPANLIDERVHVDSDYDDSLHDMICRGAPQQKMPFHFGYQGFFNFTTCPTGPDKQCHGASKSDLLGAIFDEDMAAKNNIEAVYTGGSAMYAHKIV